MTATRTIDRASTGVLYFAFALTGFATALLGATLPVLRVYWSLTDKRAGTLFLVYFIGSSLGALLTRGSMPWSVFRGFAISAVASALLAIAHGDRLIAAWFLLGLGMGIAMTSITMLRSARRAATRVRELNLLNVIWPVGALASPVLANALLRVSGVRTLFFTQSVLFASLTLWTFIIERRAPEPVADSKPTGVAGSHPLPWLLGAASFLAVGGESALGAWIASYFHRVNSGTIALVEAATLFWAGLLLSRMLHATPRFARRGEVAMLQEGAAILAAGAVLLVAVPHPLAILAGAFLSGFGAGPIYPALLAIVLPHVRGRLVFLLAGLGGASMPWITGQLSGYSGSLRIGMMAPMLCALVLLTFAPLYRNTAKQLSE